MCVGGWVWCCLCRRKASVRRRIFNCLPNLFVPAWSLHAQWARAAEILPPILSSSTTLEITWRHTSKVAFFHAILEDSVPPAHCIARRDSVAIHLFPVCAVVRLFAFHSQTPQKYHSTNLMNCIKNPQTVRSTHRKHFEWCETPNKLRNFRSATNEALAGIRFDAPCTRTICCAIKLLPCIVRPRQWWWWWRRCSH